MTIDVISSFRPVSLLIEMLNIYTFPLIIMSALILVKGFRESGYSKKFLVAMLCFAVLSASGLVVPISLKVNIFLGSIFAILLYGFFIIALTLKFNFRMRVPDKFLGVWAIALVATIITIVPYCTYFSIKDTLLEGSFQPYLKSLDTKETQTRFSELIDFVSAQKKQIEKTLAAIQTVIKLKNKEIEELQLSRNELLNEIDNYKKASEISEDKADAIVKLMGRDKIKENIISFIIGVLSSATVAMMAKYFSTLSKLLKQIFFIS